MNVLIIGSGGREHALAKSIARSKTLTKLYVAPGNPGCEQVAELVELNWAEFELVVRFCRDRSIDLVIVGPEAPLVAGISDRLTEAGIVCFGPGEAAARLEGSKSFTKQLCRECGIPTAESASFQDLDGALSYVRAKGAPIVVKADGLAAGKGVTVAESLGDAEAALNDIFAGKFGAAGSQVVIEEFLEGEEASLFGLSDGHNVALFGGAQDHKRVGDGDTGPNTGGMGAYSPTPILSDETIERAMREIMRPAVAAMKARGTPFVGLLFAGLMIGRDGPKLIEFNVRFGDPEAQAILSRLDDDLLEFLYSAASGRLLDREPQFSTRTAVSVVLAAKGYPLDFARGDVIEGIAEAEEVPGVNVFHAGTARSGDKIVSAGGRVLAVSATGSDISEARAHAYMAIERVKLTGGFFRRDIGMRALRGADDSAVGRVSSSR